MPIIVPSKKLISVSYNVTQICFSKLDFLYKSIIVLTTFIGLEKIKGLMIFLSDRICHIIIKLKGTDMM